MRKVIVIGAGSLGLIASHSLISSVNNIELAQTTVDNTIPEKKYPISSFPLLPEPIILKENQYHDGRSNRTKRREAERNLKKKRKF